MLPTTCKRKTGSPPSGEHIFRLQVVRGRNNEQKMDASNAEFFFRTQAIFIHKRLNYVLTAKQ